MRAINLPNGQKAVLSDTVGFVSLLPHELVNAFHATLEEVIEADLIIHVRDISHPDTDTQKHDVERVLEQIGIDDKRQREIIEVQNKIDLLNNNLRWATNARAERINAEVIAISALTGEGNTALLNLLSRRLIRDFKILNLSINHSDGRKLAWLYENGEVLERQDTDVEISLRVRLSPIQAARFQQENRN